MNFITWIFKRIKNSQSDWAQGYRRMILEETLLSIVLTLVCGALYILLVGWLLIPFIDRTDTFAKTMWGLVASVVMFYVYHWLRALHEVYLLERQKTWDALSRR
jgi:putative flippase GtrA